MVITRSRCFLALIALTFAVAPASVTHAAAAPHTEPARPIKGSLLIHGGGALPANVLQQFIKLAGGEPKLVVIPTATVTDEKADEAKYIKAWNDHGFKNVTVLHTIDRDKANDKTFAEPLTAATAVWLEGGLQHRLEKAFGETLVEKELHNVLARGGIIGGTSAGAAIMSRTIIRSGNPTPEMGTGFGFLTGCIIDQHFIARDRKARLAKALADHPGLVGYGIDEGTAMLVTGRSIRVLGTSTVSIVLPASVTPGGREAKTVELKEGQVADLTAMSRAAIARCQPVFPPEKVPPAKGVGGTLVIVGGGGTPKDALDAFIKAAGGPDAPIAIISTALDDVPPEKPGEVTMLTRAGCKDVRVLHAATVEAANDPKFAAAITACKGVWFSGGRQWRFVDSYLGTKAEQAFHDVLKAGGAIGGSSAGATIQGDYLVRGDPLGNLNMMAEGYERGLAFLTATAIDQHFAQRKRFKDMEAVKRAFPQLLGLGIDETTAVIVTGSEMRVVGKNNVYVYDAAPPSDGDITPTKLAAGDKYDLQERKKIEK